MDLQPGDLFKNATVEKDEGAVIEVLTTPAIASDDLPDKERVMYSIEITVGNRRFFDSWKMGTEQEIEAALKDVIDGIESGIEIKARKDNRP